MAAIRRRNLRARVKAPAELQSVLGGRPSYWSDLLRDEDKAFGEKVARRIEEARDWPDKCVDEDGDASDQSQTRVAHPPCPQSPCPETSLHQ